MRILKPLLIILFGGVLLLAGCERNIFKTAPVTPPPMSAVPAVRLNFRYEPDVPAPASEAAKAAPQERDPAVQADFDASRPLELLERTIPSPDKKHILAVYRNIADVIAEYRLDMYSPDGKLLKKLTSDTMAVHFPDTIVWSPDSNSLAFVAMIRAVAANPPTAAATPPAVPNPVGNSNSVDENT